MSKLKPRFFRMPFLLTLLICLLWAYNVKGGQGKMELTYQQQLLTGQVTDSTGQGLGGVSVEVQGTTTGTLTDNSGSFSIQAKPGDVLVIKYVGYITQELTVKGTGPVSVRLVQDATDLSQVVVIGYGTQKKSLVTGAIAQVTSKDIANKQIGRLDDALRGQAAGVSVIQSSGAPGSAPTVYVRGVTTIRDNVPLYVIDGVVQTGNGGIDYLDPNDIASMEVLKDAASAAVYGSRASNGVIIITTKQGKLGEATRVNYNGQYGWQAPITKVKMANATQYAELRNEAALNDGVSLPYPAADIYGTGTNWQDEIFSDHAIYQNHSLSLSGGSEKATYYLSAGYRGQQGIIAPSIAFNKQLEFRT